MNGVVVESRRGQAMVYEFRDGTAVSVNYLEPVTNYPGLHFVYADHTYSWESGVYAVDQGGLYYELPWL